MTTLIIEAVNEGTYIITGVFTDESDNTITPVTLTWSLTDADGKVINGRDDVSLTPSTSNSVVLQGDDLKKESGTERVFTFDGTYNSATYGNGLIIRGQATFNIGVWVGKK